MRKMANNLINDVNVKLTEWQCSGDAVRLKILDSRTAAGVAERL